MSAHPRSSAGARTAIAYVRIGGDPEEPSLGEQRAMLETWAYGQDMRVIDWCTDEDPRLDTDPDAVPGIGLLQAVSLLRTHRANALLVTRRSRISADPLTFATIANMLVHYGSKLTVVEEEPNHSAGEDEMERIVSQVLERYQRTSRLIDSARKAIASELRLARPGAPPWGYRPAKDGSGWAPHQGEQRVLALVRSLRKKGFTYASIASSLANEGVTTRTGRPFTTAGVHRMAALDETQLSAAYERARDAHALEQRLAVSGRRKGDDGR
jgi:hypothetical protein